MYPPSQAAYDRAITVFSPDGRLFQVEYAREAVKTGSTSIGVVSKDGVVLLAHKRIGSPLIVKDSHEKIYAIDAHIMASSSGLVADARKLIEFSRIECQRHKLLYDEEMPIEMLAKRVGDHIQFYTQYGGARPYGVSLIIAGVDGTPRLYETDPSGALFEYNATAIGSGKKTVEELFEKEYKEGLSMDEAIKLGMKGMKKAVEEKLTPKIVDVVKIDSKKKKVTQLTESEISKYIV